MTVYGSCMLTARRGGRREAPFRSNSGTVLIVSMWIVLVLAGLVLAFTRSTRVEAVEAANLLASAQAEAVARGALQCVLVNVESAKGSPAALADLQCEQVQVGGGFFWLLRPRSDDDRTHSYGITDEGSKVNLNSASLDMLGGLPDMTAELAASIVDWRDPDSEVTPGGAEDDYYLALRQPYHCKNAPLETVEEVLLAEGASRDLLYGEDLNRNGVLDSNEDDGVETTPPDDRNGRLDRGFCDYATVYSVEPNVTADGQPRIDVNGRDTQRLLSVLREAIGDTRSFQVMDLVRSGRPFRNVFDFCQRTGLTAEEFAAVVDRLTTDQRRDLVGLVNVNTAPREVLLCLPGLDESDAGALLAKRADAKADLSDLAWIAEALPAEKSAAIGSYVTVRSYQFCADIVSISGNGRAYKRYRTVVDARQSPARVLYWRDLTDLGWPLTGEIPEALRRGEDLRRTAISVSGG